MKSTLLLSFVTLAAVCDAFSPAQLQRTQAGSLVAVVNNDGIKKTTVCASSTKTSNDSNIGIDFFKNIFNGNKNTLNAELDRPTDAMLEKVHFLILPGFGNAPEDYTMPRSLVPTLQSRGWLGDNISVLPMKRSDWLKVFLCGALDLKFWQSDAAPTRPAFRWYLELVASEVKRIVEESESGAVKVVLVGHSAGGWLARASVGFGTTEVYPEREVMDSNVQVALDNVLGIVSLGAPHLPPPDGEMDMTRGALRITNELFPNSFHLSSGKFYVTVAGTAIVGEEQVRESVIEPTSVKGFAYNSYKAVCGDGNAIGDGVVPLEASHLDGAEQLTLENCFHSINAPEEWYGSDNFIDQWHKVVLKQLDLCLKKN